MSTNDTPESDEYIKTLQSGGKDALAGLFLQNRERLRRMIQLRMDQRLAQRVDASDILQDGFMDASKKLEGYLEDPRIPFVVWLRLVVGQRLIDVHRWHLGRKKRDPRAEQPIGVMRNASVNSEVVAFELSAHLTSPSQAAVAAEHSARLRTWLEQMDEIDREILVLRHFEELTNNEAAAELGLTKGAASKRYIRAIARLREIAEPFEGEV